MGELTEIKGRSLYVERIGVFDNEPVLVFLHHGLGSVAQWHEIPALLSCACSMPALVYDRPGHGRSPTCPEKRANDFFPDQVSLLRGLIERENIQNPVLVGHSDGGTIALMFGSMYPGRPLCVIAAAAHVFVEDITIDGVAGAAERFLETRAFHALEKYHGDATRKLISRWSNIWRSESFRSWDIRGLLRRFSSPLLVLQGELDEFATKAQVDSIEVSVSGRIETRMIADCGHDIFRDSKDEVIKLISDFVLATIQNM